MAKVIYDSNIFIIVKCKCGCTYKAFTGDLHYDNANGGDVINCPQCRRFYKVTQDEYKYLTTGEDDNGDKDRERTIQD